MPFDRDFDICKKKERKKNRRREAKGVIGKFTFSTPAVFLLLVAYTPCSDYNQCHLDVSFTFSNDHSYLVDVSKYEIKRRFEPSADHVIVIRFESNLVMRTRKNSIKNNRDRQTGRKREWM
jgi:hypothetical protein